MGKFKLQPPIQQPKEVPFNIQDWLKHPGSFVTRKELWEFVSRMEVGRRVRNRWRSRLRRFGRRLWAWLSRSPLEVEDKFYR